MSARGKGAVVSGSIGAVWEPEPMPADHVANASVLQAVELRLQLPLRPMEPEPEAEARLSAATARLAAATDDATRRRETPLVEQARRRLRSVQDWGSGDQTVPVWVWRLGEIWLVAVPGEPYSMLQTELRRRLPNKIIMVMVLTNGSLTTSYILPCGLCGAGMYQDQIAVLAPGALELMVGAITAQIQGMAAGGDDVDSRL